MIELTLVGIIISILIGIALPNFMEARIRAQVTAVKSEMSLLASAMEEYYIANRAYPPNAVSGNEVGGLAGDGNPNMRGSALVILTTPVVYISSLPRDWFHLSEEDAHLFDYINFVHQTGSVVPRSELGGDGSAAYVLAGAGPDMDFDLMAGQLPLRKVFYTPTNGTKSDGDQLFHGP